MGYRVMSEVNQHVPQPLHHYHLDHVHDIHRQFISKSISLIHYTAVAKQNYSGFKFLEVIT